ncbi:50S ribosomal protein P1 [Candidatus Marsarchaeota G2 archaeon OSP_D]|jgi:large subunit ribosomal protein L12|uniref:Large ribosomal subunit protein P1 n=7 Tax=Candidatus Marsarchaeota group 2 TaxID=2203771 RepID=A0A2R6C897_9ARCH|nr:MAG: 50S ribosomal protein P1 [Candidatus Marsarchaeota G2 archaeon ECH_B_SAG-M15]PSN92568.1 MAG: 50S ribosomal protein P1 [Candidatus Marsarchaeota G2 archaeon OSP_D]PSN95532.1 MAG: 50S ribosomal protein P1 [Candidatus Marsarchaeota G2 archaeon ECH_B_SAG-C16]PSN96650.1 MAG: 50S ribosomal protein P1 [Candidatus Marsarchaeota G2 archaeon ECH_B_2]PSO00455.1 MAG: 50S ribosomal protein P1 [Candidatus Marsarchaeota G2 archaeon ECH_B_3]PSO03351.1 MAG: 50S ribosomal protein P1 [Candidatus Marsarch
MLYIYASLLLHAGGKEINEDNLKKVVEAAGIEPDMAQIKAVAAALKGVNIDEVIKQGLSVAPAAQPQPQAQAQPQAKVEEKREEKKEEEEEVSAEGLGALFG